MAKLTAKQERFVEQYLIEPNATQAAIRAGYSAKTAREIGPQNLKKLVIAAAIEKARAKRAEGRGLSKSPRRVTGGFGFILPVAGPGRPAAAPNGSVRRSRRGAGASRWSPRPEGVVMPLAVE